MLSSKRSLILMFVALSALLLSGCSTIHKIDDVGAYQPTMPLPQMPAEQRNGSLFQENISVVLFEDTKARRVGDILTIILTESTNASKKASTAAKQDSGVTIAAPSIGGQALHLGKLTGGKASFDLSASLASSKNFTGEGDSSLSNTLSGRVTVTVSRVLSNGYLIVRGQKRLTINQGDEYVRISGIIRPMDIQPDNTVLSTLVADARISYVGDGVLSEANKMGFVTRFLSKWWPL
ncbi:Flagellar L-ring protein FlgH [hydrothermal vent metagenome]|uniref:Flagellar L-ring protein FlgH n=1 Tax=hydrothermal vent metagenome TaxID=652676 RepID=A0A3B0ZFD0_9ZZZZ